MIDATWMDSATSVSPAATSAVAPVAANHARTSSTDSIVRRFSIFETLDYDQPNSAASRVVDRPTSSRSSLSLITSVAQPPGLAQELEEPQWRLRGDRPMSDGIAVRDSTNPEDAMLRLSRSEC